MRFCFVLCNATDGGMHKASTSTRPLLIRVIRQLHEHLRFVQHLLIIQLAFKTNALKLFSHNSDFFCLVVKRAKQLQQFALFCFV